MNDEYWGQSRELVPGTLRGYRIWQLRPGARERLILHSLNRKYAWSPLKLRHEAICIRTIEGLGGLEVTARPTNHTDFEGCRCGFYGCYTTELLRAQQYLGFMTVFISDRYDMYPNYHEYVMGVVKASGVVTMGTMGFRAQHMEIEAIGPWHQGRASNYQVEEVATRYGVPYVNDWNDYPPSDVRALLPAKDETIP